MKPGSILCGGVGSGKSRTALAYFYISQGGDLHDDKIPNNVKDLYIITTARKRDTKEWDDELLYFGLSRDEKNQYPNKVFIDSWNNIAKYKDVESAFFIFDEQRVVGSGAWVKSFLKIAKKNTWILLSATPGDCWMDYVPVFIANGFYKNRTEFITRHVVYSRYSKFPKIDKYLDQGILLKHRRDILVDMDYKKSTILHNENVIVDYDLVSYRKIFKDRWNIYKNTPIDNISELCFLIRKVVNSSPERVEAIDEILIEKKKVVVFYNFDYELDILREYNYSTNPKIAEWNGHKHESIPSSESWIYLVQYSAGCEGWNCVQTDTIVFYSQSYSYKTMIQASGRIDRLNTPFTDLYYYHIRSNSGIDAAIYKALKKKKNFNERDFV